MARSRCCTSWPRFSSISPWPSCLAPGTSTSNREIVPFGRRLNVFRFPTRMVKLNVSCARAVQRADRFRQGGGFGGGQAAAEVDPGRGGERGGDIGQSGGQRRRIQPGIPPPSRCARRCSPARVRPHATRPAPPANCAIRDAELGGRGTGGQVRMRPGRPGRGSGGGRCAHWHGQRRAPAGCSTSFQGTPR